MDNRLSSKSPKDPILAADWNALVSEVVRLGNIKTDANLRVRQMPYGVEITSRLPPGAVFLKFTTPKSGGGFYNGRTIRGEPSAADPTSNLSIPETGETVSTTDDVLIEYMPENSSSSHGITSGTFGYGFYDGISNESPPRPVVRVYAGGAGIPQPTAKYQVYTPIDDTLVPIWTSARYM